MDENRKGLLRCQKTKSNFTKKLNSNKDQILDKKEKTVQKKGKKLKLNKRLLTQEHKISRFNLEDRSIAALVVNLCIRDKWLIKIKCPQ